MARLAPIERDLRGYREAMEQRLFRQLNEPRKNHFDEVRPLTAAEEHQAANMELDCLPTKAQAERIRFIKNNLELYRRLTGDEPTNMEIEHAITSTPEAEAEAETQA